MNEKSACLFRTEDKCFNYGDLIKSFRDAGVLPGETIFVHSKLDSLGKLGDIREKEVFLRIVFDALSEAVGRAGNIIMPTFTYSFCREEIFDPKASVSRVGIFSEYFRNLPGVERSIQPIFSIAARGERKDYFCQVNKSCFGEGSCFHKLFLENARLLFIGDTFDITFMHFVEQGRQVPYRFFKNFSGQIKIGERIYQDTYEYYVKYLDKGIKYDLEKIADFFEKKAILRSAVLGRSLVRSVAAKEAASAILEALNDDIFFLLREKPDLNGTHA